MLQHGVPGGHHASAVLLLGTSNVLQHLPLVTECVERRLQAGQVLTHEERLRPVKLLLLAEVVEVGLWRDDARVGVVDDLPPLPRVEPEVPGSVDAVVGLDRDPVLPLFSQLLGQRLESPLRSVRTRHGCVLHQCGVTPQVIVETPLGVHQANDRGGGRCHQLGLRA